MTNNEVIAILHSLIGSCKKGFDAFRNASESVQNSEFRRLFNIFSQQRAQFVKELESETHRLGVHSGEVPERNNTIPFRTSTRVKQTSFQDEATVVAECQREEETAVNDYQEALKSDLPLDIQYVVKRQYMDIKDAYDRIRILQRAA